MVHRNMKGKMADTYSYVSGELRCALFRLFVDGILRNTNKKKLSKWSHQNIFARFFVSNRPKLLLFSNKRKTVKIGQNAFTLNQGDTPLLLSLTPSEIFIYDRSFLNCSGVCWHNKESNCNCSVSSSDSDIVNHEKHAKFV